MKILVTGGCGFIGSNFIEYLLKDLADFNHLVINLDDLTYAGSGENLKHMDLDQDPRYKFEKGNICDKSLVNKLFYEYTPDIVFNFAAESHVDRSIIDAEPFRITNFNGAGVLLDTSLRYKLKKFIQVSTDEVYGSLTDSDRPSLETDPKHPTNMYSASKSGAEDLAMAAFETHNLPVIITRSSNNYGPYQHPEKFIPKSITNLINNEPIPLMNQGKNIRDWLYVKDNCKAIWFIAYYGKAGEIYNISGNNERTNIDVAKLILKYFNLGDEMIEHVGDRKGHDFRYSINDEKLKKLGFRPKLKNFEEGLGDLVNWCKQNEFWWGH